VSENDDRQAAGGAGPGTVLDLLERARAGDTEAVPALRAALDDCPGVWRAYGDLASHAQAAWVELIAGKDLALRESLTRRAGALARELAGPAPEPLERLLAERIAASWLQVHFADAAAADAVSGGARYAEAAARRQDAAHRRYVAAIGALATLKRLLPRQIESVADDHRGDGLDPGGVAGGVEAPPDVPATLRLRAKREGAA
jgi:hypothetical protein